MAHRSVQVWDQIFPWKLVSVVRDSSEVKVDFNIDGTESLLAFFYGNQSPYGGLTFLLCIRTSRHMTVM